MARLPSKYDLSRPGSLRSGRAIAAADTSAIGRGLQSFGASVSQVGADIASQQNAVDLARAEAYKTEQLMAVENEFANDPDFATASTRAAERTQQVVNDASGLIRDQSMRTRWQIGAGTDAARVNDAVIDRGVTLQRQAETVAFDEALEANRRIFVDPATPEAVRAKARADIQGAIEMGAASGLLTPGDASERTAKYLEDADYSLGLLLVEQGGFDGSLPDGDAAALLRQFEGFSETPYWDVNANRIGYGSDTITKPDGSVVKVTPGMTVTREDAERDLARRAKEFEATAIGQVGPDAWAGLPANARAALTSVSYNYGSLPTSVVNAVKGGDIAAISAAVAGLQTDNDGVNRERRLKEAAIIAGQANPEWYQRLSPEQRQVVDDRVAARDSAAATSAAASAKLAYEQHKDERALGILTGRVVSEAEILGDPLLNDGDKTTLLRSFRTEQEATGAAREYLAGLAIGTGTPLNPYDADDRALGEKAYGVLESALTPEQQQAGAMQFVEESGYVPKPVIASVRQGLSSTSPETVANAMAQAAALDATAPNALRAVDNGGDIIKAAELAQTYTGMGYTPAEAAQKYIAANDPQAIKDRDALLKSKPVADALKNVTTDNIVSMFPGQWVMGVGPGVDVGGNPAQAAAMVSDYKSFYEEAIVDANGDLGAAQELAKTRFQRVYGPSTLNRAGAATVVRLPPEKTYRALPDGSYDYIRVQLEEALRMEGVAFEDVSLEAYDDTNADFSNGAPARYQVSYLSNGQWQMFNLPFVADYEAALADYTAMRQTQVDQAGERQQANQQDQLAREAAAANQPPADEIDRLSNEAWAAGNETLSRVVGGQ